MIFPCYRPSNTEATPGESKTCLDVNKGLRSLGGRRKIYDLMVSTFYSEYEHGGATLVQLLKEQDPQIAIRFVHSIKGAAGQVGSDSLALAAARLEDKLKEESKEIDDLLIDFQKHLKSVLIAISFYLKSHALSNK